MEIRLRGVIGFAGLSATFGALGVAAVYVAAPKSEHLEVLTGGALQMAAEATAAMLAITAALTYGWLESRDNAKSFKRKSDAAHERITSEIAELVRAAQHLLSIPKDDAYTLLPNDVWHAANQILRDAHRGSADTLDYEFVDFYNRVRLLQKADAERVRRIGDGRTCPARITRRDAQAVVLLGQVLLNKLGELGYHPPHVLTLEQTTARIQQAADAAKQAMEQVAADAIKQATDHAAGSFDPEEGSGTANDPE